ncbi:MAG: hypothetical protein Q8P22_08860 [Chloroflexota bacterium]|nr:hypothetical protein [Chloroflexota bacterium]
MKPADLVRALRAVPEKKLRLVELAWELVREDGSPDVDKAADRLDEVGAACAEVNGYTQATQRLLWQLKSLARS